MLYLFENFALDADRRELRRGKALVSVEPRVFDLLAFVIENRARVVSRDDLLASVWDGRIVSESALTTSINAARSVIGDSGEQQRLIKTLPRKGIRFVGLVLEEQRTASVGVPAGVTVRPIADADWPALCAYDAAAFGADRSAVLAGLRGRLRAAELVATRAGAIAGFLVGRDGGLAAQIGPLIADDDAIAGALAARALDRIESPLFVDLADSKRELRSVLDARGFAAARQFTRMLHGSSARFDDAARTFAVVGPEFG